ncbi:MAG: tRNA (adenosine(37)-N6)-dimethylallyltransferase MiaA [Nitrospinae bacterium RIFCSPLOWO2_02_FULL_39_110]|nr:MAG: tRNA (adenosine(37)-N6)-dimethylallyltransferase MiaA [Nitrospinae bacterium RIFCSPHIGHO2_02_39_11]OGV99436.1 MAG: tRNA (adenosine(37)-N6)-dimethylallyltransferase MiaA [Nitrospinae bacterium RIFCSPHIGHO2_12_FULL_39_42]OGW01402.1 MAG: tRNA (adenosine(37)-N6)-dimethylallyltransferase MiaA [Nitrospinae bacterium RIFCSPHIGHO2_02_FULL_39_82]OGW03866.1 MAG: tRNA (adenosine(37)-N6)-dimethylallyltransferase MiaA [Nitrospinae bacterium RIFCSPLOWO2_02_FULL_39_110]OGW06943.1 MAG: tRNA (adenosine(
MIPLIVIAGPTAVGKSDVAFELAERLDTEIISADSMQVYKYFDIGTAKSSAERRKEIPHHLIDIVNPDEDFSAGEFNERAFEIAKELNRKGKIPLVTGGTGLYIKALIENLACGIKKDNKIRERIKREFEARGEKAMYERLRKIDPSAASKIHPNDRYRIERALEVYYSSGKPISEFHREDKNRSKKQEAKGKRERFKVSYFVLNMDRKLLYKRIEERVDGMISAGLLYETEKILKMGYDKNLKPFQCLGYLQMIKYLDGEMDFDSAVQEIKKETRRFAKRQLTWFKGVKDAIWIDISETGDIKETSTQIYRMCHDLQR